MTTPKGISIVAVYADDFATARAFYEGVLGLKVASEMGANACLFTMGEGTTPSLYLEGGHAPAHGGARSCRASFAFEVDSTGEFHRLLVASGREVLHPAPQPMGGDVHWFLFRDPAGNVLEATGPA